MMKFTFKLVKMFFFSSSKEYQDCKILVTNARFVPRPVPWSFQKHSPYLDIFNFYLHRFEEIGAWNAIERAHQLKPQSCQNMSGSSLELTQCITAFVIFLSGLTFASLLCIIETCIKRFLQSRVQYGPTYLSKQLN